MLLDMALGSEAPTSFQQRCRVTAALLLIVCVTLTKSAPTTYDEIEAKQTDLAEYFNDPNGCYYNYQHYEEGDRIVTNEPCLNCTCHNRMLMCYLRVCPFSKAIGQDCTVQKTPDQCCPTISCPEVPVHLLTSSTTQRTTTTTTSTTTVGWHDNYGCMMDENGFFPDGAQVPIDPKKPCELCYCIRNRTACVIQECTLHVEGCRPVYQDGVCCPVRYDCDYEIEKSTTTTPQISGGLVFSTTSAPFDCRVNDEVYTDGESIAMNSDKPCEHCYCMRGDIVCVVQDCGEPLRGKDCTPEAPPAGQCCPTSYQCANETMDSYSVTTLQPASQSDTDEHEAEKFPSNDDVYNKLGENQHESQQDDINNVESDHANTTPIPTNEILPVGMSDQTGDVDEETHDSVPDSPAEVEGTTAIPASEGANKINGDNQQDISSAKPDFPNQVNPIGTESDPTKLASTDKPVDSTSVDSVQQTQSTAADSSSVNENAASPTTQATSDGNNNDQINDENVNNGNPVENPIQDDLASNLPVVTTENAVESETQSSNLQNDKSPEGIQQQTDAPSVIEKEPTKSSQDEQTPALNSEITPQSEITTNKIEDPPKKSGVENTENNVGENKIQTSAPLSEDFEQTTQQINQHESEKTHLDETNTQTDTPTSSVQDSFDQSNQLTTQTPQDDISVTVSPSNVGPNAQNNDNSQEGNVFPTEIPKVENEPVEQNQLPVENKPQAENQPESENASSEQNQDSPQVENEQQTEVPNVENEPTEQNKLQEENKPAPAENKPESEKTPAELNQDSTLGENVSPTELPKVEDQNKLQEENVSPTGLPAVGNQDNTQEGNVSPTDVPKVENEPTDQNKPLVEDNSQPGSRPESDSTATEPISQDSSQSDNESSTEIPKVENDLIGQNKPLIEDNSQTGNQPESDSTAMEPNSINNSQSENESSTEIPKVENEPTEQNKPLEESVQGTENQPESGNKPIEQNQDSPQVENSSSTDIPFENEPIEQNKPIVDTVTEQNNQDNPQSENVSPTEIPKVENEPTEQNKPTAEDKPEAENKPESENVSTNNIHQDSSQLENESPTEIPKVENEPTEQNKPSAENSPIVENQPESDKTPVEPSNQDSSQTENLFSTDTPKVENEPVEQNKPTVDSGSQSADQPESQNTPTEINSPQVDSVSSTDVPKVENEPTEQNKPPVESSSQSENQPEPQNTPTDANHNTEQVENVSSTDAPKVENEPTEQNKPPVESSSQAESQSEPQNTPTGANQDSQQIENVSPTEIPKGENEPNEQNKPLVENSSQSENQPEPQNTPTGANQDSQLVNNVSPTEIPKVENEPNEQNKPLVENSSQSENQPEPQNTPTGANQDSQLVDNVSSTEIPKVENEPNEQNKPLVENSSQSENQPEPQNTPTGANQDSQLVDNVSSTEIPKVENEPNEQNKPLVENSSQSENQPEPQNTPTGVNQDSQQTENVSPTDIPTKLSEPQPDNVIPVKPDTPVIPVNDLPPEQPINDNNIFTVTSTSKPLSSQNQVKDNESTMVFDKNENSETENKGDNATEKPQQSADDKISSIENINTDNNVSPVSSTELTPESNNASPQTNDENTEHSTETKPIENKVNADVSDDVVNTPIGSTPATETDDNIHSELINQGVLVDDPSSQDNEQSIDEENVASNANSDEHQTETPTGTVSSTNGASLSIDEHVNDVTTSLPQQQLIDNNIPVQPEVINQNEPVKTQDEIKIPSDSTENSQPEKSTDSQVTTEINKVQNTNELLKPTELPTSITNNGEQFVPTQIPDKINENESVTSYAPSQDENVNEILDQTTVYPDTSSDKNNLNTPNELNENSQDNVTPLFVETSTNAQSSSVEPIKNINQDVSVENESSTISQPEKVNEGSSENADNIENSVTTNNYANLPSIIQTTNVPTSQENDNKGSFPVGQSDKIEINTENDQPANVKPQESFNSEETSTQYNADDSSTNSPGHESPSVNNNMEANTNAPTNPEIPNEINQDSATESELYATETPTEQNILAIDSNKTPTNDATMEAISNLPGHPDSLTNANEIPNESSSEGPDDADKLFVTKPPDYVIDITAVSSESPNNVPEAIKTGNEANEVTTSNIDKNNDGTTELYDNVQHGVPGEGSCLIDFVTYAHKAIVPKSNPCHEKCECLNSIVTCTSVNCPPAPPQHRNCIPLHPGNESWCCPTYMCEGGIEGMIFENHNNDGAPQLISTVVLEDKPGEENNDNTPINEEIPTTPNPQIESEYNTLTPQQADKNSDINSQDSIGVTEVPAQFEIPNKQVDDSVASNGENIIIPTTIANFETIENEKPVENDNPVESDQPSENEKPVESDKPTENEKPEDSIKPVESDQPTENEKPIDDAEADVTTVSYAADGQIATNKPDTPNNAQEQNVVLPNTSNESQDYPAPTTEIPNNYESTVHSLQPDSDQKQPGQNSDSDDLIVATTYKPEDSVVGQLVDDNKTEEVNQPAVNEEADAKPIADVTNLPPSDISPVEVTQTPISVADTRPTITANNDNGGFRPSSIDDIINSVNMVKDAVKNSLETSSKPAEIDYQTTVGVVEDYQPTEVVPESPASPLSSENPLSVELPQTTVSSADVASELPATDAAVDEKLPEGPVAATESSGEIAGVTVPSSNESPSTDPDHQGSVSTELPSGVPDQQEIATGPPSADVIANRPEGPTADGDDKTPEVTTVQYSPSVAGQDPTADRPLVTSSDVAAVPQSNAAEQGTSAPATVVEDDHDDKSPEIATARPASPAAASGPPAFIDDVATETAGKPDAETPVSADADKTPVAQAGQTTDDDDKRFGEQSSTQTPPSHVDHDHGHGNGNDDGEKRPQEEPAGDMVNIPFDTETPSAKPSPISSSTPAAAPYSTGRPSYTPIPQSTWTQKPFHQDSSTSEAPQPDQGFPDEYDDENEAVYGPGTCRYGGKIYVSAQQVPRDDPCDFCFCFRGDIICLQQSCPPPIFGCYQENIQGFCCPRYECPVAQATSVNVTTTTTTTTTMVPPHFFANAYRGAARRTGCLIHGHAYRVGEDVGIASGPCLECICGADGKMACDPKPCSPEPLLRKMMAEAVDQRRR